MVKPEDYYTISVDQGEGYVTVRWRDARKIFDPQRYYEFCRASFADWTAVNLSPEH